MKPADLVGTIVGAITSPDATVIGHLIQSFRTVRGGSNRTHDFARRVFALHAGHGLVIHFRIFEPSAEIGVHADPMHGASQHYLLLANHRDVIFRLASDHASVTTHAFVQIDGHAPGIAVVFKAGIERKSGSGFFLRILGKTR